MKGKLICKIFGHDFRIVTEHYVNEDMKQIKTGPSNWCSRCGLTKKELLEGK